MPECYRTVRERKYRASICGARASDCPFHKLSPISSLRVFIVRPCPGGRTSLSLLGLGLPKGERTTINLSDFTRFCTDKFDLRLKAQSLSEPRKRPQIPISCIFMLVVGALALRKQSFHQIDLFARHKGAKKWLGTERPMVASDATLWRVMPQMKRSELRSFVHQAYRQLRKKGQGKLELPSGRKIRAAAVDGSNRPCPWAVPVTCARWGISASIWRRRRQRT